MQLTTSTTGLQGSWQIMCGIDICAQLLHMSNGKHRLPDSDSSAFLPLKAQNVG